MAKNPEDKTYKGICSDRHLVDCILEYIEGVEEDSKRLFDFEIDFLYLSEKLTRYFRHMNLASFKGEIYKFYNIRMNGEYYGFKLSDDEYYYGYNYLPCELRIRPLNNPLSTYL